MAAGAGAATGPGAGPGAPGEQAADELAIRNLLAEYCHRTTTAETGAWAATWSDDARWTIPKEGVIEGREAIAATFERIRALYVLCVQEVLSGSVEVKGDEASAFWYVRELQWREGDDGEPLGSELIGTYEDELVRTDAGWRFSSRVFTILYVGKVQMSGRLHVRYP